jgi:hypothetical protein
MRIDDDEFELGWRWLVLVFRRRSDCGSVWGGRRGSCMVELRANVLRDERGRGEPEEAAPVTSSFEGGRQ